MRAFALLLIGLALPAGATELVFVGDVSFAGRAPPRTWTQGDNPLSAFAEVFREADLAVANAEGLLTTERPAAYAEKRLDIGASPAWARAFREAGIDLVGLANNHTWDGGASGLLENARALADTKVSLFGAAETAAHAEAAFRLPGAPACVAIVPATLKSNRPPRRGAAAAYYPGAAGLQRLTRAVSALRDEGCAVLVSVHWGREGVHYPPSDVRAAAHALVDAGARVVVGHHPHVLQGVEFRRPPGCDSPQCTAAIAYSLGNFVFWNRDPRKTETGVLSVRLSAKGALERLALRPARISGPNLRPKPVVGADAERFLTRVAPYSEPFGTRVTLSGGVLLFEPPPP